MTTHVLVTGGAGFIGSYIVDALLAQGYEVRVLDNLTPQVHGPSGKRPAYLNPEAELVVGDVRDRSVIQRALQGVTYVSHQAAVVGVGQSMYQVAYYSDVNVMGTATLLDVLANEKHNVERLVVASSMSIYGEGAYICPIHGSQDVALRPLAQMREHDWEVHCPVCNRVLGAVPTGEAKPLRPTSVYAVGKRDQEEMCLAVGRAYNIPTIALRYFNTYGPRQALSNPYTGAVAIFSSCLLNNQQPIIYEDGLQSRDFTHVTDIAQANVRALEAKRVDFGAYNIGTGVRTSLLAMLETLRSVVGSDLQPSIQQKFREGDIRHCFGDISAARADLDFEPAITLEAGLRDLLPWLQSQNIQATRGDSLVEQAQAELAAKGLTK